LDQTIEDEKSKLVLEQKETIDAIIVKIAPEYPIEKLNRVDLAILRLGVYELKFDGSQPPKVVIDEAIELAKEFGGSTSPGFINGALGKLLKDIENEKLKAKS
jgi:N utilization substance protein B